jgi:3-hydroxyacyl-CoA dehydrogenase
VSQPNPDIRLGIAGSGAIACGLARLAAGSLDTVVWARSDESAARTEERLGGRARVVTELDALGDRTIVVEAVAEEQEVKADLLGGLGVLLPGDSLLATTTSSLSVTELAEASARPERFAGLHVFNPVEKMRLIELAFPDAASESTRAGFRGLCEILGRTAVEVPDVPGFVVNRLLFPYAFEAVRLLDSTGLEPEAIDTCMTLGAGHPLGPLALLDLVGLDVSLAIGESIGAEVPERLTELVAAGRLGRKSGAGFFEYGAPRA